MPTRQVLVCALTLIASIAAQLGSIGREQTQQVDYNANELSEQKFLSISRLTNKQHLRDAVQNIMIPRIVGTEGHKRVRDYIVQSLTDLQWTVELHKFHDTVPRLGKLQFQNIIAVLNPRAERYLVLACHYDSKYMPDIEFVGATDSAVPCAMLLNLAMVLQTELQPYRNTSLSLMLLFFDGEEAFETWSAHDSIYGARHLAEKWQNNGFLQRLDMLVLLDLLGMPDPKFYSFFKNTESWYSRLMAIEERLANTNQYARYASSVVSQHYANRYFQPNALRSSFVEDDHIPFLKRNVPIIHLIPLPFPDVWHTKDDNASIIDYATTEHLALILRIFTIEYISSQLEDKRIDKDKS